MNMHTGDRIKPGHGRDVRDISGPWMEIDLKAITHNINQIGKICRAPLMPVIKANAYGHGVAVVGRHLEQLGVYGLCVGTFQEAAGLRAEGIACPVMNLGPYTEAEAEDIVRLKISQSVYSDDVHKLDRAAERQGTKAGVHIKIDTGLGRLGVSCKQAPAFIEKVAALAHIRIEGVFTSLTEDKSFDMEQLTRFNQVVRSVREKGIDVGLRHAASSAAILEYPESHLDLVRPGIMVVGCYPSTREFRNRRIDLRQTIALKARVCYVKELQAGDSVAYHQAYTARSAELLATGAIGYPDGYPSNLDGKAQCLINGRRYPLVAAITANNIYIKAGRQENIRIGDEIVLIGRQKEETISVEDLAEISGISEYKLLACLNPLLPRYYLS